MSTSQGEDVYTVSSELLHIPESDQKILSALDPGSRAQCEDNRTHKDRGEDRGSWHLCPSLRPHVLSLPSKFCCLSQTMLGYKGLSGCLHVADFLYSPLSFSRCNPGVPQNRQGDAGNTQYLRAQATACPLIGPLGFLGLSSACRQNGVNTQSPSR